MARRQTSRDAKKLKDKWKSKQWYSILAPDMFNRAKIGETLADEPEKLLGRTVEVTLQDLTGDFRMMHIKLKFRITDHSTSEAYTRYLGHDLTSDYIRRQTRRKRTKMEGVFDVDTKDGYRVRIKPMAISDRRIQSSVQYEIRKRMNNIIQEIGNNHTMAQFTSLVLTSDKDRSLVNLIQKECKGVYPVRRIDVRRMEVLMAPEKGESTENVFASNVPEEEESEGVEKDTEEKVSDDPKEATPEPETTSEDKSE
jgi:small subunit ribosomal protein S3Ae